MPSRGKSNHEPPFCPALRLYLPEAGQFFHKIPVTLPGTILFILIKKFFDVSNLHGFSLNAIIHHELNVLFLHAFAEINLKVSIHVMFGNGRG